MGSQNFQTGSGFLWGLGRVSCPIFGTCVLNSVTLTQGGDEVTLRNSDNVEIGWYGYNQTQEVNIEYTPISASATLSASMSRPSHGVVISITDAIDTQLNGKYITRTIETKGVQSDFTKVVVTAKQFSGIPLA